MRSGHEASIPPDRRRTAARALARGLLSMGPFRMVPATKSVLSFLLLAAAAPVLLVPLAVPPDAAVRAQTICWGAAASLALSGIVAGLVARRKGTVETTGSLVPSITIGPMSMSPLVEATPGGPPAGLRVVAIDDDRECRDLIRQVLENAGMHAVTAGSVAEGLDLVVHLRPDVVVSDISMPGDDGYEFVRKLRLLPPEYGGRTPVVALTAYARDEDRAQALQAGFAFHVSKPCACAELLAAITRSARGA